MLTFCSGVQRLTASAALSPVSPCAMVETRWYIFTGQVGAFICNRQNFQVSILYLIAILDNNSYFCSPRITILLKERIHCHRNIHIYKSYYESPPMEYLQVTTKYT